MKFPEETKSEDDANDSKLLILTEEDYKELYNSGYESKNSCLISEDNSVNISINNLTFGKLSTGTN